MQAPSVTPPLGRRDPQATGHVLVFTDLVESTRLVQRVGDAQAAKLFAEHDRRARDLLDYHRGREIDHTDGFFLLFTKADDAARYVVAYHAFLRELALAARAGMHVGWVTLRENSAADIARGAKRTEVEGLDKALAARIMGLARPGQTLVTTQAYEALTIGLLEKLEIESHGHYRLKGIETPVALFELGVRSSSPFAPPIDVEKAYRIVRAGDLWLPLREVRHNLPAERDLFVGRATELHALSARLDAGAVLLTVLGSGGTGKTRLVRRYAWTWLGDWPGGVYFCDLSDARSLDGIFSAVANAFDLRLGKEDPGVQLGHAIAGRGRCLVIFDNFEQVCEYAVASLGRWLDRVSEGAFLVTSRERLQLIGEEILPIEPLPLDKEAIELFVARARNQSGDFVLNDSNRAAVAEIVRLLDGLPLAIELAAARSRVLSPSQLVDRMKDRFGLLAGARTSAARQATLRTAIDWSWNLLSTQEQAALAQCSVFEGGFTLEAAEAILDLTPKPGAASAMDTIQALVDKSLLRTWVPKELSRRGIDAPRFGMYLSVHEYAKGKLESEMLGSEQATMQRHGRYFSGFGTQAAIESLFHFGGVGRFQALRLEIDNVVAACGRAIARGEGEIAVGAFRASWEVLDLQGPVLVAVHLGEQVALIDGLSDPLRALALMVRALASWRTGRADEARTWFDQSLSLSRATNDRALEGRVLGHIAALHVEQGRISESQELHERALAIHREMGDQHWEGVALASLGNRYVEQGRMAEARAYYEQALEIHQKVGNRPFEGIVLGHLGILSANQGLAGEEQAHYRRALEIHREVGNRRVEGVVLSNLGSSLHEQGRLDEGLACYQQALAIAREVGDRRLEGNVLGSLGILSSDQGRVTEARGQYEAALAIHREIGNRSFEGMVLGNLGLLCRDEGLFNEARAFYEAALAIHRELGNRPFEGIALGSLGDLLAKQGRIGEARQALVDAEALLRKGGGLLELAKVLCVRGQLEGAVGNFVVARSLLAEIQQAAETMGVGPDAELSREIAKLREVCISKAPPPEP